MPAIRTLSVYLLKPVVDSARTALKEDIAGDLREHAVTAGETRGTLFVQEGEEGPPDWVRFLADVSEPELLDQTRSLSGILVLEAANRWFAITFGHARHLLDSDRFERDFGLHCALNGVDPEHLRGAEGRTFDDYALHTLRQLSRLSTLESLELNTDRELVVALAGQLEDGDLGKKVDGRDAVRLTAEVEPSQLASKCAELLRVSELDDYGDRFPFFDRIKRVRDPVEIARLNKRAFTALGEKEREKTERFDLFPPQIVSEEIVVFRVSPVTQGLTTVAEPDIGLLRYPLPAMCSAGDAEAALRRFRLQGIDADGGLVKEWTFFECLHWEIPDGESVCVLDAGQWYRVQPSLVGDVVEFAREIESSSIRWPDARIGQREEDYCKAAAEERGLALLDQRFVKLPGQTKIEACDLFSEERQFVHVKHRKGGSSPLSHLFAQAMVSAECFVADREFRRQLRELLGEAKEDFGRFSPDHVDSRQYSVILAMITSPTARGNVAEQLPFFSKITLRLAVRRLESMGFEVFVDAIPTRVTPTGLPVPPAKRKSKRKSAQPSKGQRVKVQRSPKA